MQSSIKSIKRFLSHTDSQWYVPIFQRLYSWNYNQCKRLFDDYENLLKNKLPNHFLGSIVLGNKEHHNGIDKEAIIDGQQRITTVILSIIAFINSNRINNINEVNYLKEEFLINKFESENLLNKYKLNLIKSDQEILINLIESIDNKNIFNTINKENNIYNNYEIFLNFFNKSKISFSDFKNLILDKLSLIIIKLDNNDDPQFVFESMNSTGVSLDQGDLIKNYLLLGYKYKTQEQLYLQYWKEMENFLLKRKKLDTFFKNYLTIKTNKNVNEKYIYENLKELIILNKLDKTKIIEEIYRYFQAYKMILENDTKYQSINNSLFTLNMLEYETLNPFLIKLIDKLNQNDISNVDEVKNIINFLESYVVRRTFCDLPTGSIIGVIVYLLKSLDYEKWYTSVLSKMISTKNTWLFPNDTLFKNKFIYEKNFYSLKLNKKILMILEMSKNIKNRDLNYLLKNATLEHILPQGENVPDYWKEELGDHWKDIWETYVDTIGNITFTNYNSEMSNKSFHEKKTMDGGFNETNLWLNTSVNNKNIWNKDSIIDRATQLFEHAVTIWPYPNIKILDSSLDLLNINETTLLIKEKFQEILSFYFQDKIKMVEKKRYINFCYNNEILFNFVPYQNDVQIFFDNKNMIIKSNNIEIEDYTGKGHWGSKNFRIKCDLDNIENSEEIVKQIYLIKSNDNK